CASAITSIVIVVGVTPTSVAWSCALAHWLATVVAVPAVAADNAAWALDTVGEWLVALREHAATASEPRSTTAHHLDDRISPLRPKRARASVDPPGRSSRPGKAASHKSCD